MVSSEFVFEGYRYDAAARALSLTYRFTDGPRFTEELRFDVPDRQLTSQERVVLDRIFRLVFLAAGVSYYKAYIPRTLRCEAFPLDRETAAFMQVFYERGLAEFAYRNGLSLRDHLEFAWEPSAPGSEPVAIDLPRRTCVPVGGGKDSIVTLECLKRSGEDVTAFALGSAEPIAACIATAGVPTLRVHRRLDSQLFALNQNGALNGHVPITGILSTIVLAVAVLAGCDTVAMSNEHSASVPNLVADGVEVNHQYSKSLDFERMLADHLCGRVTPGLSYFSLLRPLSEIEIARRFAGSPQYFPVFRSCNAAFKQSPTERARTWCGNCPKCRFVFLALAPFVGRPALVEIFGRDLLDDPAQGDGFAELCGLKSHKPFECVGDVGESAAVMAYLGQHPDWGRDAVVRRLAPAGGDLSAYHALFRVRHPHRVPDAYLGLLDASR